MHRVSWNPLLTSPSRPLGCGCHYPGLILVFFYVPLSDIENRCALPIVKATGQSRLGKFNPHLHQGNIPPTYPEYTLSVAEHCSDTLSSRILRFCARHGVKTARICQVLH